MKLFQILVLLATGFFSGDDPSCVDSGPGTNTRLLNLEENLEKSAINDDHASDIELLATAHKINDNNKIRVRRAAFFGGLCTTVLAVSGVLSSNSMKGDAEPLRIGELVQLTAQTDHWWVWDWNSPMKQFLHGVQEDRKKYEELQYASARELDPKMTIYPRMTSGYPQLTSHQLQIVPTHFIEKEATISFLKRVTGKLLSSGFGSKMKGFMDDIDLPSTVDFNHGMSDHILPKLGVYYYTGDDYPEINKKLAKMDFTSWNGRLAFMMAGLIDLSEKAEYNPKDEGVWLYRGMKDFSEMNLAALKNKIGRTFVNPAFYSTASEKSQARTFQMKNKEIHSESVLIHIHHEGLPYPESVAVKATKLSKYPEESEIIFAPYHKFRLDSVQELNRAHGEGKAIIHLTSMGFAFHCSWGWHLDPFCWQSAR